MLLRALILRPLRRDLGRTVLTVLAVALGVAVVVALRVANRAAVVSFETANQALAGGAELLATGPQPIPASLLARLAPLAAEADISPYLDRQLLDPAHGDTVEVLGLDFVALAGRGEPDLASLTSAEGAGGQGLLLAPAYAALHHLRPGGEIELDGGTRRLHFRIAALLPVSGAGAAQPPNLAVMDLAAALAALSPDAPAFDGLRIRLAPGAQAAAVAAAVQPLLPIGDQVAPPAARVREDTKMLAAFRANLAALSYASLLIGIFLIYNTVSISVVRRRMAVATVRALGATQGAVLRLFVSEGLVLALAGGVVGALLGWFIAEAALGLVQTAQASFVSGSRGVAALDLADVAWGLLLAGLTGVLAAFAPARQAARLMPAEALRAGAQEAGVRARVPRFWVGAAAATVAALACPRLLGAPGGVPLGGFASALAAVAAWGCLTPPLLAHLLPGLRARFFRHRRFAPALAAGGLAGALRRTSVLVLALATAVGVMFGVAIMVGSFRRTVQLWLGQQLQGDVFVRAVDWTPDRPPPLPAAAVEAMLATPGVAGAQASHSQAWAYRGAPIDLNTRWWLRAPPAARGAGEGYTFLSGSARGGAALVSEPFARRFRLGDGGELALDAPLARLRLPVAGVFFDYSNDRGLVAVPATAYRAAFGAPTATEVSLVASPGVSPAELRRRVLLGLQPLGLALDVHDNAGLRAEAMRVFDQTFRITYALEIITLLVAILGVANTLLAVVLERAREFAILRFLGCTTGQTRRLLLAESGLIGGAALAVGLGLGGSLALILVRVVNVESFGWTIQFHLPVGFLLSSSALVWVATLAAGWLPARAAATQDPLRAVGAE